jgi:UDP-GlcNAc:undecaprenyl-phosphate GlcNAc-1-phosphate transferase
VLAVIRRVRHGQSPFAPDKRHLHHRLLRLGHSHRRAVGLLYFWTALLAFGGVSFAIVPRPWVLAAIIAAGVLLGLAISLTPGLRGRASRPNRSPAQPVDARPVSSTLK